MTEDEMVGWYQRLNGHEFEQAWGDGERQGSLASCSPWDHKESDMSEGLNNNSSAYKLNKQSIRQYTALTCSFPNLEPVCFSMFGSNCCFLTCLQVSQEAGKVIWYSHHFRNFPLFIVIYTVKVFGIVNKAEIDVFPALSCFFHDPADVGNLLSGSSTFSKTSLNI